MPLALNTETLLGCKIKIFDNHNTDKRTNDRFTVVFIEFKTKEKGQGATIYDCIAMNYYPFSAQGFCQHSTATLGRHLGKRISFMELPTDCQQVVINEIQQIRKAKK